MRTGLRRPPGRDRLTPTTRPGRSDNDRPGRRSAHRQGPFAIDPSSVAEWLKSDRRGCEGRPSNRRMLHLSLFSLSTQLVGHPSVAPRRNAPSKLRHPGSIPRSSLPTRTHRTGRQRKFEARHICQPNTTVPDTSAQRVYGGFNWSSQHLEVRKVFKDGDQGLEHEDQRGPGGDAAAVARGPGVAASNAFSGQTAAIEGGAATILAPDRGRGHDSGGSAGGGGVGAGRITVVPSRWRYATADVDGANWSLSQFRGARGDRDLACSGTRCPVDRAYPWAGSGHDQSGVAPQRCYPQREVGVSRHGGPMESPRGRETTQDREAGGQPAASRLCPGQTLWEGHWPRRDAGGRAGHADVEGVEQASSARSTVGHQLEPGADQSPLEAGFP